MVSAAGLLFQVWGTLIRDRADATIPLIVLL
jgi:hypothetical protein